MKQSIRYFLLLILVSSLLLCTSNKKAGDTENEISDEALLDSIAYRSFQYFWDGAEPSSGLARERYHIDGIYPKNDYHIVTSGGSGFGLMAIIAGVERGYITREEAMERFEKVLDFLERADCFHGVFPHWWNGETGKVRAFSEKDNGGDLVESSFLFQGLLCVQQYCNDSERERSIASRIEQLWRKVDWDWHRKGENLLYWHWSAEHTWEMNFPIRGYNECLITYILAASSPTHPIPAEAYHEGWAESGKLLDAHEAEDLPLQLRYQSISGSGPLFWAHYSFLGLDPNGLKDRYADYFEEMKNLSLVNRAYCIRNPKQYKGYGEDCWGLSASYSINGYAAHQPYESDDWGVISPTAALSSIVYTPQESMQVMRYLYKKRELLWGKYGFYDAFSETQHWYPQRYLAIDQGPIAVMIENYRSGLLWKLFMSHPDVQKGLKRLGFQSPHLNCNAKDTTDGQ